MPGVVVTVSAAGSQLPPIFTDTTNSNGHVEFISNE